MRMKRALPWMAGLAAAALCAGMALTSIDGVIGDRAALGAKEAPAPPTTLRPDPIATPVAAASTPVTAGAPAAEDFDPAWPTGQDRLIEQIETARQGLAAAQAAGVPPVPAARAGLTWTPVTLLGGGAALIGCAVGIAMVAGRRGRRRAPVPASVTVAAPRAPAVKPDPVVPRSTVATPGPDALEARLRSLERSMLQLAQAMEDVAARTDSVARAQQALEAREAHAGESTRPSSALARDPLQDLRLESRLVAPDVAAPGGRRLPGFARAVARAQGPASREPWELESVASEPMAAPAATRAPEVAAPRPTSLAATIDGRDLARIRHAVLRLGAEGWDSERIARQLRIGEGAVDLILKTSSASPGDLASIGARR